MPGGIIPRNYTESLNPYLVQVASNCQTVPGQSHGLLVKCKIQRRKGAKRCQCRIVALAPLRSESFVEIIVKHRMEQNCGLYNEHSSVNTPPGQCVHVDGLVKAQQTLRARDDPNGIQAPQQSEGCWRSMKNCLQSVCTMALYGSLRYDRRTIFWTTARELTQDCKAFANRIQTATAARCHKYQDLK